MTQAERDRLVALKKARKKLITQKQAAEEIGVTERHVRRLLKKLTAEGDKAVIHGLRGRVSNRRLSSEQRERMVQILSEPVYQGFGPTLAAEYLAKRHQIRVGRETLRQLMSGAGLWRARKRKAGPIHTWRARRERFGELVQWDTSDHDWLEGRGEKIHLIRLMDDATSRTLLRFVGHDSTEENLKSLGQWLVRYGRMQACYTDKASLFQTTEKRRRDQPGEEIDTRQMPPTQIGRALAELNIGWTPAHSPEAKGRVERGFSTDQDRLVKGMRVAGVSTLEGANAYLETEYEPWWEQHCTVQPAHPDDAHRPLSKDHNLASILSLVHQRKILKDYTIRFQGKLYQIDRRDIVAGLRGTSVRIEQHLDGSLAMAHQGRRFVRFQRCGPSSKVAVPAAAKPVRSPTPRQHSAWMKNFDLHNSPPLWKAARAPG